MLLEQLARLGAGVLGLLDRPLDALAPLVEHVLDRSEGVALQDEEGEQEADDRPDHQTRDDLDQARGGDERLHQIRT